MVRVNFWLPHLGNVGHASAEIELPSQKNSVYISWWPEENPKFKSVPGGSQSLTEDEQAESRAADISFDINGLNEGEITSWWDKFRLQKNAQYQLTSNNCSGVIVAALKAGGSDSFLPWHMLLSKYNISLNRLSAGTYNSVFISHTFADDISKYRKYVRKNFSQIYSKQNMNFFGVSQELTLTFGERFSTIWTPISALVYCDRVRYYGIMKRTNPILWWIPSQRIGTISLGI